MRWPIVVLGVLLSAIVIASPIAAIGTSPSTAPAAGSRETLLATDAIPISTATSTAALPSSTSVSLTLTLTNSHSGALDRFLAQVEDPASPSYRHFLSFSEYTTEFAPPPANVMRVEAVLAQFGAVDIAVAPDRSSVSAVLPAATVDQLLGVQLVVYGHSGPMPLYTAVGTASVPSSLQGLVSGVGGLSDLATVELASAFTGQSSTAQPLSRLGTQFVHDNATGNWYLGSDFTQAYGATDLFPGSHSVPNPTYPTRVAIATLLGSSYNETSQENLPPWDPAVIGAYFNGTLGPGWPMPNLTGVPVSVDNVTPPPPGSLGAQNDSSEFEDENSLDLEMAGSLAPGSSVYNFYFAGSLLAGSSTVGDAADYLDADLSAALAYNYSPRHLVTISCSFGLPDVNDSEWNAELLATAAMGVTVVSASGDQGDAPDALTSRDDGQWPIWPATAASNVSGSLSAGGVSLELSGTPTSYWNGTSLNLSYDANAGSISSMSAWYDTSGGQGYYAGTEGGVSTVFPEPYWQFDSAAQPAIVNATVLEGASSIGRAAPDLAMPANSTLVTVFANSTGTIYSEILEGTSVAAPVLAGLLADVVAVENSGSSGPWTSLGFVDPEIYRIASYYAQNSVASGDPFLGVTTGANYVFSAAPGWNPTTGWGGVSAVEFLSADRNSTLADYRYTGPTPGLPPASSSGGSSIPWTFLYVIFGVGVVVALLLVFLAARPPRRAAAPSGVPWGAQYGGPSLPSAAPGGYPGATFICPYCGAVRPAEPVRCPRCGAY